MSQENLNKIEDSVAEKADELVSLPPKVQRFIQLYITGSHTIVQMAELLEVSPRTCHLWLDRQDVQRIIAETQRMTQEAVALNIKHLSLKAINRLADLVDSPVDTVALGAVKDILDRAGHKPRNEIKIDKTVHTIEEQLKNIIDVTLEDTVMEGEFVDSE